MVKTTALPSGMVTNGVKMSKIRNNDEGITAEYVNDKLEQILSALFDTLEHNQDRIKALETQVHKLTKELRNGKA